MVEEKIVLRLAWLVINAAVLSAAATERERLRRRLPTCPTRSSASVSVIDTATDKVTATFNVGGKPRGIALSPDAKRLYISDQAGNAAIAIDFQRRRRLPDGFGQLSRRHLSVPDGRLLSAAV
jgi:YVTN family beta-propeller protein